MRATSTWGTWARWPRRPTSGATPTSSWPRCSRRPRPSRKKMDDARLRHALAGRAPLPARGLRVHSQHPDGGRAPGALTKRLHIGCGFNIAPMWHPLRLAEDFATADILTEGRVVFGVGRGYHSREVETFGAPMLDAEANRELFEEQVDIIMKAFNRSRSPTRASTTRCRRPSPIAATSCKEITLVPRPVHRPVECWQPIVSASAARARLHGAAPHQGPDRRRRGHHGRGVDPRPIGRPPRAPASTTSSARTSASASSSTSPSRASAPCARSRPGTRST